MILPKLLAGCVFLLSPFCWRDTPVHADDTVKEAQSEVVVEIDFQQLRKSSLGSKLLTSLEKMAQEEIGDEHDAVSAIENAKKSLGFDPLEEIQLVRMFVSNLNIDGDDNSLDALADLNAIIKLKKNKGNLEGLMLAVPDYDSESNGDETIHFLPFEDKVGAVTFMQDQSGNYSVVGTVKSNKSNAKSALNDLISSGSASDQNPDGLTDAMPEGQILHVRLTDELLKMANKKFDGEPPANVLKRISSADFAISEIEDELVAKFEMTTDNEKSAEQIAQFVRGISAMLSFFEEDLDDEFAKIKEVVESMSVEHEGNAVSVKVSIPNEDVLKFLREEADLPIVL